MPFGKRMDRNTLDDQVHVQSRGLVHYQGSRTVWQVPPQEGANKAVVQRRTDSSDRNESNGRFGRYRGTICST